MDTGLSVKNLSFSYGSKSALTNVTFNVAHGTFCALLGPNGAGKSTLFGLLTRLFTTREGSIDIAGHDLASNPRRALAKMGVVFQQSTLDLDLTVMGNLQYFAALHGLSGKNAAVSIESALIRMDMLERAGERVRKLNGGHRRRTEIARSLVHSPLVLLLDEPTVGLDAESRININNHVHELCNSGDLTVVWATHLTDEVFDDDQLIIINSGQILANGKLATITDGRPLTETYLEMVKRQ